MLMPVFSALPGAYGIGCFSKEAYEFVDILKEAGQKLWQILPLGRTGYGDSPYQSFSTLRGTRILSIWRRLIEDEPDKKKGSVTRQISERMKKKSIMKKYIMQDLKY